MRHPYKVLFLCVGNSCLSIMAEALMNVHGQGVFKGYSAGSRPIGKVHPLALRLLESKGYNTARLQSKSWDEFRGKGAPAMDFIFSVCEPETGEECPSWPEDLITANWTISDPADVSGDDECKQRAFQSAYETLARKIQLFCRISLGTLDRMALTWTGDDIGRTADVPPSLEASSEFRKAMGVAADRAGAQLASRRRGRPPKNSPLR